MFSIALTSEQVQAVARAGLLSDECYFDGIALHVPAHMADPVQSFVQADLLAAVEARRKIELAAYAADKRWREASAGTSITLADGSTVQLPTDDTAYVRLKGAAEDLERGIIEGPLTIVIGGRKVTADLAIVEALYGAISRRWQDAFNRQGLILDEIDAGRIATTAQIDAAWSTIS